MTRWIVIVIVLVATSTAQTTLFPGGTTGSGGNAIPFSASFANDIRYQLHVSAAQLTGTPALLTDLLFQSGSSGSIVMPMFELSFGPAAGAPTCNLAGNAPSQQIQFSGPHTYTFAAGTFSSIGIPISYVYDGVSDLLIDLRILGSTGGAAFEQVASGSPVMRVYNRLAGGSSATTCSHQPSVGLILGLTFLPLSGPFSLSATTLGGGIGNLDLALTGIPAATFEGWTVLSTNTTGAPGAGPVFGLTPDSLTILLATAFPGAQPGNPIHWAYPGGSLFPDAPAIFPPGTFTPLGGFSVDFLAVAFTGLATVVPTPIVRIVF